MLTLAIAAVWPTLLFFVGWPLGLEVTGSVSTQALGWAFVSSGGFDEHFAAKALVHSNEAVRKSDLCIAIGTERIASSDTELT